MSNSNWQQFRKELIDTAMGRTPADTIIRRGRWVCVQSGEIIPKTDIAIKGERIAFVGGDASHTIGPDTMVIDAEDRFLVPGLLDGHMHIESTMMTVTNAVRAVVIHGVTGLFVDPHEIANVLGLKGVRLMVDEAAEQPIHVWVQVPSCVPSAPGLETSGATITSVEVAEAMTWDGIIGLGEVMNFPAVFNAKKEMLAEMAETANANKVIGGHYPSPDLGLPFHAYAAGGPEDDHEGTRMEDAIARVRQGMKAMLRLGSAWHDVVEQVRAITEEGLDPRNFILCTDDSHAGTILNEGHMDRVVRHAIAQGLPPITAIQMATINTAQYFGVWRDVGMIAPGRYGDILLVSSLAELTIDQVIARGQVLVENGSLVTDPPTYKYPDWSTTTVKLSRTMSADDFVLPASGNSTVTANVIGVIENQAPTRHLRLEVTPRNGQVHIDMNRDLAKIAHVERHKGTGGVQVGLVQGFGFTEPCAVASTVAHDSHHMLVAGTDEDNMAMAVNELARIGGGQIVVRNGKVIGLVELPIAGLMSDKPAEVVSQKAQSILEGFTACGCTLNSANMQLSLLALVVIPELRISDLGLVDVTQFKIINPLET